MNKLKRKMKFQKLKMKFIHHLNLRDYQINNGLTYLVEKRLKIWDIKNRIRKNKLRNILIKVKYLILD